MSLITVSARIGISFIVPSPFRQFDANGRLKKTFIRDLNSRKRFCPQKSGVYIVYMSENGELAALGADCTGGIRTRATAERLLQDGVCDLVGIGRPPLQGGEFLRGMTRGRS